jgi:hypothetical protein
MRLWLPTFVVLSLCATLAAPARADDPMRKSTTQWHTMDDCSRQAFRKYPDYTAEANAKREAFRRLCLRNKSLPAPETTTPQDH